MSCENEKCKWHLNPNFPCHRKTVGTKVHAFEVFIAYVERCVFEDTKYKASCLSSKRGERDSAKLGELTGRRF